MLAIVNGYYFITGIIQVPWEEFEESDEEEEEELSDEEDEEEEL